MAVAYMKNIDVILECQMSFCDMIMNTHGKFSNPENPEITRTRRTQSRISGLAKLAGIPGTGIRDPGIAFLGHLIPARNFAKLTSRS